MADIAITPADLIATELRVSEGTITTTSLKVAEHFGKRHADVLRAIEKLLLELPEGCKRNFALTSVEVCQPNGGTRVIPAYSLTRDGFTLLAMGFTGKDALKWKLAYIAAFNRMADELTARHEADLRRQLAEAQKQIPHTLSPAQKLAIKKRVAELAYQEADTSKAFARIYRDLYEHFDVSSYSEIPSSQFEAALAHLGGVAKLEQVSEPVAGVFLPKAQAQALQHHLDLCWNLASRARRDMGAHVDLRATAENIMFHSYEAPVHRALIALR